jgi:hypothetical protein
MKRLTEMWNAIGSKLHPRLELSAASAMKLGFRPAFLDYATMSIYPSRFADGRPAPFHCRNTLPDEAIAARMPSGAVLTKDTVLAGFERDGFFYTPRAVERACKEWGCGGYGI